MTYHLPLLLGYSALMIAVGTYIGRRVQSTEGFFVASRGLGPGLLFATLLAANVGAGSTVGAAGLGYRDGVAAWWWVGAAAIGSLVQAFWVGPWMRREAASRGLKTVGDYLEQRYSTSVRVIVALLLWFGTLAILAGQLIAMSTLLTVVAGLPKWAGCVLGGVVMTAYFTAGGLLSSAWVNLLQLTVLMAGFAVAVPAALGTAGGWSGVVALVEAGSATAPPPGEGFWNFWQNGASGWKYLALLGPAFIISPGLLQKIFGARDDRTVRLGTAANAVVLLGFACVPMLAGIITRALHPGLPSEQLALPTLLMYDVPVAVGALGLAALFSAEVSTADAILFMLATSLSQDLYRRFVRPAATDAQVLRVARGAAVAGGVLGVLLALVAETIIGTLSFFYSVLGVCLFVPVLAGLFVRRFRATEALAAIGGGMLVMLSLQLTVGVAGVRGVTPALAGVLSSVAVAAVAHRALRGRVGRGDTDLNRSGSA
ncbi:sodium:solute symporter [Luteitalea sp.]|uniref:sodium:solute symporter family protein n=1 Tax=Luteitalea sp. TaxID=2004800 RepID=UPI0025C2DDB2|nr:sodium:solute symporter family protein [Luteitalea sp.]